MRQEHDNKPDNKYLGAEWRALRKRNDWNQEDVRARSIQLFGEEGAIEVPQLSRMERGGITRISFEDAVHLGAVFGMEPNEVARMYGYWGRPLEGEPVMRPAILVEIEEKLPNLPESVQELLLSSLKHALWVAEMQAKMTATEPGPGPKPEAKRRSHTEPPTPVSR